ncbi:hypothetical protein MMC11_001084 [Xylographa trunciseda]|nr:hypothetical protein [Xylographa trunciseda]
MASQGPKRPAELSSDSEWEYEYHDTETESFFVTLDLPSAPSTKKRKRTENSTDTPTTPNNASTQIPDRDTAFPDPFGPKADLAASPDPENRIQILDLHTREPVISYKNQTYTCQWTSTIGTDILLTPPDPAPPFPPLYEGPGFNVLATTNIKLVGEPVQLIPHTKGQPGPTPSLPSAPTASSFTATTQPSLTEHSTAQADESHISTTTDSAIAFVSPYAASPATIEQPKPQRLRAAPATPSRLAVSTGMSSARQSQGRFLDSLTALKAARGEQDEVLLHHRRRPNDSGWKTWTDGGGRARKRRMLAGAEEEQGWEEDDSEEAGEGDEEVLEGSDEDDSLGEGAASGPANSTRPGEAVDTARTADTTAKEAPT